MMRSARCQYRHRTIVAVMMVIGGSGALLLVSKGGCQVALATHFYHQPTAITSSIGQTHRGAAWCVRFGVAVSNVRVRRICGWIGIADVGFLLCWWNVASDAHD